MTSEVRPEEISAVSTGWRPGGFSSSTLRSMSPYCASARERGIGVAVITRMSAARPLAPRSMRWRTPKRCCSSTTARRRSWKVTSAWKSAWVPTRICGLAGREGGELGGALGALVAAGQDVEADAGGLGEGREREQVLAGEDLGRRHQRRLAAGLDGGEHGEERDQGLAGADVALQQAVHPELEAMSAVISATARSWAPVGA